jgi:hypothetical protein
LKILVQDIPEEGLSAGDMGTLVEKHEVEGLETGYDVEFFDMLGKTITVVTLPESSLRWPTHGIARGTQCARPSVRLINFSAHHNPKRAYFSRHILSIIPRERRR